MSAWVVHFHIYPLIHQMNPFRAHSLLIILRLSHCTEKFIERRRTRDWLWQRWTAQSGTGGREATLPPTSDQLEAIVFNRPGRTSALAAAQRHDVIRCRS